MESVISNSLTPMLTIFSIPKAFRRQIGVIQTNAIRSWTLLRPKCEVILFGDEEGTAEIASDLGIRHILDVERNEYGTPLVNSMFTLAQNAAKHQLMCYINADIILMNDFMPAISRVKKQSFLLVGRRWDTNLEHLVDFNNPDWEAQLRGDMQTKGTLHPKSGIDYFAFTRGLYSSIPPFAIGRTAWDNWLVYKAYSLKVPVIDATKAITAIHQNHGYPYPMEKTDIWKGPESERNRELMGGKDFAFSMDYATFVLTPQGLSPTFTPRYLYFRIRAIPVLYPHFHFLLTLFRLFEKFVIGIRSIVKSSRRKCV